MKEKGSSKSVLENRRRKASCAPTLPKKKGFDIGLRNKHAQLTIFVIIAILIVVSVVLFFLFYGKIKIQEPATQNPIQTIDNCVDMAIEPSIKSILDGGGRIVPPHYLEYKSEEYNYLCYEGDYYKTCTNTYPRLKAIVEEEIKEDSFDRIKKCFEELDSDFENKGFNTRSSELNKDDLRVEIVPGKIRIYIDKDLSLSREESSQSFEGFDSVIISPLYELIMIAREIVNQESQYCNFDYNGYMILYPEFQIKRIDYRDNKIYKITHRASGQEFRFAVRSCSMPGGM